MNFGGTRIKSHSFYIYYLKKIYHTQEEKYLWEVGPVDKKRAQTKADSSGVFLPSSLINPEAQSNHKNGLKWKLINLK